MLSRSSSTSISPSTSRRLRPAIVWRTPSTTGRSPRSRPAWWLSGPPRDLLESLAGSVADAVLGADPRIDAVTVTLRKLRPPLAVDVSTVGVAITRVR